MKEFDLEVLPDFDGENGNPIYIAYRGKVYDVSRSGLWDEGLHMKRHHPGESLTSEFAVVPYDEGVFERYPQVGVLVQKAELQRSMPSLYIIPSQSFSFPRTASSSYDG